MYNLFYFFYFLFFEKKVFLYIYSHKVEEFSLYALYTYIKKYIIYIFLPLTPLTVSINRIIKPCIPLRVF